MDDKYFADRNSEEQYCSLMSHDENGELYELHVTHDEEPSSGDTDRCSDHPIKTNALKTDVMMGHKTVLKTDNMAETIEGDFYDSKKHWKCIICSNPMSHDENGQFLNVLHVIHDEESRLGDICSSVNPITGSDICFEESSQVTKKGDIEENESMFKDNRVCHRCSDLFPVHDEDGKNKDLIIEALENRDGCSENPIKQNGLKPDVMMGHKCRNDLKTDNVEETIEGDYNDSVRTNQMTETTMTDGVSFGNSDDNIVTHPKTRKLKRKESTKKHHCDQCQKEFSFKTELTNHLRTHTSKCFTCHKCPKTFASKGNMINHVLYFCETVIKPYKCAHCKKAFKLSSCLTKHLLTHTKIFKCDKCSRLFSHEFKLKNHLETHTTARLFECDKCHKRYKTKWHLGTHTERVHDSGHRLKSITEYKCNECDSVFTNKKKLNRHKFTHYPYQCDECNKRFAQKDALNQHLRVHAGKYKCIDCESSFIRKHHLKRHMLVKHEKHKCNECDSVFTNEINLNRHKFTHYPYQCDECNKRFAQKDALNQHLRVHARKYKCKECDRGFRREHNLKRHMLMKHSNYVE